MLRLLKLMCTNLCLADCARTRASAGTFSTSVQSPCGEGTAFRLISSAFRLNLCCILNVCKGQSCNIPLEQWLQSSRLGPATVPCHCPLPPHQNSLCSVNVQADLKVLQDFLP